MEKCNFCDSVEEGMTFYRGKTATICEDCVSRIQKLKLAKAKRKKEQGKKAIANRAKLSKQLNHSFKAINGGKS